MRSFTEDFTTSVTVVPRDPRNAEVAKVLTKVANALLEEKMQEMLEDLKKSFAVTPLGVVEVPWSRRAKGTIAGIKDLSKVAMVACGFALTLVTPTFGQGPAFQPPQNLRIEPLEQRFAVPMRQHEEAVREQREQLRHWELMQKLEEMRREQRRLDTGENE